MLPWEGLKQLDQFPELPTTNYFIDDESLLNCGSRWKLYLVMFYLFLFLFHLHLVVLLYWNCRFVPFDKDT